jgi:hypothetical protein
MTTSGELSRSPATAAPLVAMPSLVARAAFVPMPSAASAVAERNGVSRRAEAPASAVEAASTVEAFMAEAVATERPQLRIKLLFVSHIQKGRIAYAANEAKLLKI